MPPRSPETELSSIDKSLIRLLSNILLEGLDDNPFSNKCPNSTILTSVEYDELLYLLEEYVEQLHIKVADQFVRHLSPVTGASVATGGEIYVAERKRRGRPRGIRSTYWNEFVARISDRESRPRDISRMSARQFYLLERRLLQSVGVDRRVIDLVISFMEAQESDLFSKHFVGRNLNKIGPRAAIETLSERIRAEAASAPSRGYEIECDKERIAGCLTVVSDIAVLFTTRDWSVAGTISTISGTSSIIL